MGTARAQDMAEAVSEGEIDLHTALVDHLQANHFPPISPAFIPVAMEAIKCANEGTWEVMQTYPSGLLRPVRDTIEGLHLEPFLEEDEDGN